MRRERKVNLVVVDFTLLLRKRTKGEAKIAKQGRGDKQESPKRVQQEIEVYASQQVKKKRKKALPSKERPKKVEDASPQYNPPISRL